MEATSRSSAEKPGNLIATTSMWTTFSVRNVWLSFSESYTHAQAFECWTFPVTDRADSPRC